jgi:hypothetical protein
VHRKYNHTLCVHIQSLLAFVATRLLLLLLLLLFVVVVVVVVVGVGVSDPG